MAGPGKPTTLQRLFQDSVAANADRLAQGWHDGTTWQSRTYREFGEAVRATALGLLSLGAKPGDRIGIWSRNSPRWAEIDFANLSSGLATVPVYDTLTPEKAGYILRDAGAEIVFVQDAEMVERAFAERRHFKGVKQWVVMSGKSLRDDVMSYAHLLEQGSADRAAAAALGKTKVAPDDLASLVYTSGTTGEPKGVMLTHWNFASNANVCRELVKFGPGDVFLSFLPLSHVFERTAGHFAAYTAGAQVVFSRGLEALVDDMGEVHPTIMTSVPRLYEKIYGRVQGQVAKSSFLRRAIFNWAIKVGREANVHRQRGDPIPSNLQKRLKRAHRFVYRKLQARVGGRIRYFVSGGAALSREIEEFFWAAGIQVLQGYGLTETSPVTNVNLPAAPRFGSVGRVIPGTEIKIDTSAWTSLRQGVEEGEILFKGPNVMQGYWKDPKATKAAFDKGWFRTGDIGYLDEDGYLFITDRKKEIIVMSNGKNVAPQPIENMLKLQPTIGNACVLGDGRNYMSALVVPDFAALEAFAKANGLDPSNPAALVADQRVVSHIEREVEAVNARLSRYEQLKKFWIMGHDWTVESGELTPSLKVKRRVIADKYAADIDRLYPDDDHD